MKDFRDWRRRKKTPRWAPPRRGNPRLRRLAPAAWLAAPLLAALLLPLAVIPLQRGQTPPPPAGPEATAQPAAAAPQPKISVYLSRSGQIESLPLDDYVTGVLAAEMPADFELEALKAQAVAARTFIMRRLLTGDASGVPVPGADVTDTVSHQAYVSKAALEQAWERGGKSAALAKLRRAVLETRGVVMTYKGQPITASFFASSGGFTENSEDYWSASVPYLRSVASPWEKEIAPYYTVTTTFSTAELLSKLGITTASSSSSKESVPALRESAMSDSAIADKTRNLSATSGSAPFMKVLSRTSGHHIKEISIGGVVFTGREVREKLQLRSSQFTWTIRGSRIMITTYGNGHGVGMSQWGANGMAKEGKTATQILKYYYSGISFTQVSTLLKK
ncbi:stage II sporulation protein D [Paenibacillus sp. BR2-3]|uniref:stage II sporulation protein D n=1 Tax=Paenibacillus sp. BR2-3 TaxID=3048494 RepID=UPI00397793B8